MLQGCTLLVRDGEICVCNDLLFDDEAWGVRYMVADTHCWLPARQLLAALDLEAELVPVKLTRDQFKTSSPLDLDAPVSRRYEHANHKHLALPHPDSVSTDTERPLSRQEHRCIST